MKQTFRLLKQNLTEVILFAFAVYLLFGFVLIWLSPDNTIWIGETNIYIRSIETVFLCFIVVWSLVKIIRKLRKEVRNDKETRCIE